MSALTLSGIIFALTLGGIFLGTLLRRTLPEHHLNEHAKDVVRLGVGLIATMAALVLGLLIAAAKGSFAGICPVPRSSSGRSLPLSAPPFTIG